jgi:hypothetical protein
MIAKKKTKSQEAPKGRVVNYKELKQLSEKAVLADIQTMSFSADAQSPLVGMIAREFNQKISTRGRAVQIEDDTCIVLVEFEYKALLKKEEYACVQGSLVVFYTLGDDADWGDFDESCIEQFAEINGLYNTWSYIRELVASSLTRLGLSGVLLPLWRPPTVLPPKDEFATMVYTPEKNQE